MNSKLTLKLQESIKQENFLDKKEFKEWVQKNSVFLKEEETELALFLIDNEANATIKNDAVLARQLSLHLLLQNSIPDYLAISFLVTMLVSGWNVFFNLSYQVQDCSQAFKDYTAKVLLEREFTSLLLKELSGLSKKEIMAVEWSNKAPNKQQLERENTNHVSLMLNKAFQSQKPKEIEKLIEKYKVLYPEFEDVVTYKYAIHRRLRVNSSFFTRAECYAIIIGMKLASIDSAYKIKSLQLSKLSDVFLTNDSRMKAIQSYNKSIRYLIFNVFEFLNDLKNSKKAEYDSTPFSIVKYTNHIISQKSNSFEKYDNHSFWSHPFKEIIKTEMKGFIYTSIYFFVSISNKIKSNNKIMSDILNHTQNNSSQVTSYNVKLNNEITEFKEIEAQLDNAIARINNTKKIELDYELPEYETGIVLISLVKDMQSRYEALDRIYRNTKKNLVLLELNSMLKEEYLIYISQLNAATSPEERNSLIDELEIYTQDTVKLYIEDHPALEKEIIDILNTYLEHQIKRYRDLSQEINENATSEVKRKFRMLADVGLIAHNCLQNNKFLESLQIKMSEIKENEGFSSKLKEEIGKAKRYAPFIKKKIQSLYQVYSVGTISDLVLSVLSILKEMEDLTKLNLEYNKTKICVLSNSDFVKALVIISTFDTVQQWQLQKNDL